MTIKPEEPGEEKPETETPPAPSVDPNSAEALQKERDALNQKLQGLEKQVTDVTTENATLRQRFIEMETTPTEVPGGGQPTPTPAQDKSQVDAIAELAETNAPEALRQLNKYHEERLARVQADNQKYQEQERKFNAYVQDLYEKDPQLKPYDKFLEGTCRVLVAQGMNPYAAANKVVADFKKTLEAGKPVTTPPAQPVPPGARGERVPSVPPPKPTPPEPEETTSDVVGEHEKRRREKATGRKE